MVNGPPGYSYLTDIATTFTITKLMSAVFITFKIINFCPIQQFNKKPHRIKTSSLCRTWKTNQLACFPAHKLPFYYSLRCSLKRLKTSNMKKERWNHDFSIKNSPAWSFSQFHNGFLCSKQTATETLSASLFCYKLYTKYPSQKKFIANKIHI